MIAPLFDEESFVRDVQIELGFEHEELARKILEVARTHYIDALSMFAQNFIESATSQIRSDIVHLMAEAIKPQQVKSSDDDETKRW